MPAAPVGLCTAAQGPQRRAGWLHCDGHGWELPAALGHAGTHWDGASFPGSNSQAGRRRLPSTFRTVELPAQPAPSWQPCPPRRIPGAHSSNGSWTCTPRSRSCVSPWPRKQQVPVGSEATATGTGPEALSQRQLLPGSPGRTAAPLPQAEPPAGLPWAARGGGGLRPPSAAGSLSSARQWCNRSRRCCHPPLPRCSSSPLPPPPPPPPPAPHRLWS